MSESEQAVPSVSPLNQLPTGQVPFAPIDSPELVFAVVGAVGTDLHMVCEILSDRLAEVGYRKAALIRLSDLLRKLPGNEAIPHSPYDERTKRLMDAGDNLRGKLRSGDALALLGVLEIRAIRKGVTGAKEKPARAQAYILQSLKHEEEVATLRRIYGRAFHLIAAFSNREDRVDHLAAKIAQSRQDPNYQDFRPQAEELINRDDRDQTKHLGQDVRDTYPLADLFVNASSRKAVDESIRRFIELLFNHPFHTPTPDEFGMFQAKASALRSSDLSRQVGAVISHGGGEIISLGYNDVPRPGGGHYSPNDIDDARDFIKGFDPNTIAKRDIVSEIFKILKGNGWLSESKSASDVEPLVKEALMSDTGAILKNSQIMDILEFGRVVHAEMSALSDAALRGVSVKDATLYCTTFPCHNCARHLVASGISRVVYLEPYPKSIARRLLPEAIVVDGRLAAIEKSYNSTESEDKQYKVVHFVPFFGIAPSRYFDLFSMPRKRKLSDGSAVKWKREMAKPRLERMVGSYLSIEEFALSRLTGLGQDL